MEPFLSVLGCVALPIGAIVVIGIAIWIFRANLGDAKGFKQERQAQINSIRSKGISSPAVIISAKNGIVKGAKSNQRMLVTFEVEVQPDGRSPFRTIFKDWVHISQYTAFVAGTDRPEDVGQKIWVVYDPNNIDQIMFEYYDKDRKYILERPVFEQIERRNKSIRDLGVEVVAVILETEELQITNVVERDHLHQTIMRLKLEVTPPAGEPYLAETQSLFSNSSLPKYQAGKKVKIKFNPQDRAQVALIGSAE